MSSRPLSVLLVAEERRLLRQMSRLLQAFGYQLQQAADKKQAATLLEGLAPDLLIIDADPDLSAALELCRVASDREASGPVHTLVLLSGPTAENVRQALAAGVDDLLAKPLVYGELLVRLRAAARSVEFDRRLRQQAPLDPRSALPSRAVLYGRLLEALRGESDRRAAIVCVIFDIDFLGRINQQHGRPWGDKAVQSVAAALSDRCDASAFLSSLDGGRFAVLLADRPDAEAADWTEQARQALAAIELSTGGTPLGVTVSAGIARIQAGDSQPQQVLDRATSALQAAKQSGRNCTVCFGQFDDEIKAWAQLAAPGRLFERTLARDVMTPWTLELQAEEPSDAVLALLGQARLEAAPVVDRCGRFAGLVLNPGHACCRTPQDAASTTADRILRDVPVCEEETPFAQVMECFTRDDCNLVVVTHQGEPTGYVSRESLALLGEPVTAESFAPSAPFGLSSDYLRVIDA